MENQINKKARLQEEDGISQLPQPLLHHILCYLSQKEAIQTCVLSKSWRHLGPTRPKIEFSRKLFNDEEEFLSVVEKTLQRYHDQNLSIQEILIHGILKKEEGSEESLFSLLEKWVPIVLQKNMGVNKFDLSFSYSPKDVDFSKPGSSIRLPSSVLSKAEFLKELNLHTCQINPMLVDEEKVRCKHLRKLSLDTVYITDATLEKIMSSCPLIEELRLSECKGLQTITLTKAPSLKSFKFRGFRKGEDCRSIEIIDAPSIESIEIAHCPSWIQNYFPRLKSLRLVFVRLSNESIDFFSTNFPCLEKLTLWDCFSDSEQIFKLSSRTIKHLTICVTGPSLEAAIIDIATNLVFFEFTCKFVPSSFSFTTTTSTEWKSIVRVGPTFPFLDGMSSMFRRLPEIFKALRTSQISLCILGIPGVVPDHCGVVLLPFENLSLKGDSHSLPFEEDLISLEEEENSLSSVEDFLNGLFRDFRPRNIQQIWHADHGLWSIYNKRENQLIELLCKILLKESERAHYFGQLNLEDVKMEASNENEEEEEWRGVEGTSSFSELFALPWNSLKIRFRLKWRIE